ncbi:solute carrier family 25 member 35 [Drosophila serrata]|uniref:solute carrier family 25 member 35 n=1 Tax=Drosophila serrata TaxID=7274 RepID=UPI000A1D0403|nr:solute carrier family 25 member 35 [Drosophila serrata]XP_020802423.1 solute carrier family 25 member 35 [Drosophila serrata]
MATSDFVLGGVAAMGAGVFTNPVEVIKTRIQLQGELAARGSHAQPYKSVFQAFVTVAKNDGILGLQKGLAPALCFQFVINSFRLSIYTHAVEKGWVHNSRGEISFARGMFWGALGGIVGSYCASPFFLIKTQLQAQAAKQIAVGYQHPHTSMNDALRQIYRKNGVFGLWRGSMANVGRATTASAFQIATFGKAKSILKESGLITHPTGLSFCSGLAAGSFVSVAITPLDVITTRLYNQGVDAHGRGLYYNGWLDCVLKILRSEGVHGLYKGFWPIYLRSAPYSTLVLLFFDELIALRERYNL